MILETGGFEVLDAMRRKEAWRDIPVIVITAKDLARLNGRTELIDIVHAMILRRTPTPA